MKYKIAISRNFGYRIELLSEDLQGDVKKLKDQAVTGSGSDLTESCSR